MSVQTCRLINLAAESSLLSNLCFKHGAVLTKGGKKVLSGHNQPRSTYNGKLCCSYHSEIAVLEQFRKIFIRKKNIKYTHDLRRLSKKFDIYTTRTNKMNDNFVDGFPCKSCLDNLKKFGIKNIIYTSQDGSIHKKKIRDLDSHHLSEAQTNLNQYINLTNSNRL